MCYVGYATLVDSVEMTIEELKKITISIKPIILLTSMPKEERDKRKEKLCSHGVLKILWLRQNPNFILLLQDHGARLRNEN
jgi:putative exporter of polyketide antibiotics